jgi:hypothetical protein
MTSLYAFFDMRNCNDNYDRGSRRWARSPFDQNEFNEGHSHDYFMVTQMDSANDVQT